MDARTLMSAMSYSGYPAPLSLERYKELVGPLNQALIRAHCNTVPRSAMFLSQIGAETGSLRWEEELADGSAYNGRSDLGNSRPGDGPRFKGRSYIQITGRANYTHLSEWAYSHGYIPTRHYFVDHPEMLAHDKYAFLGPVWYWTVARNMNRYADNRDINGGTYAVNGGYNNLSGRAARWYKCLSLGSAILPTNSVSPVMKKGTMYTIIYDEKTKIWYAWAPGFWHRFNSANELAFMAAQKSCINGEAARKVLAMPAGAKRNAALASFGFSNTHTVLVKNFALKG